MCPIYILAYSATDRASSEVFATDESPTTPTADAINSPSVFPYSSSHQGIHETTNTVSTATNTATLSIQSDTTEATGLGTNDSVVEGTTDESVIPAKQHTTTIAATRTSTHMDLKGYEVTSVDGAYDEATQYAGEGMIEQEHSDERAALSNTWKHTGYTRLPMTSSLQITTDGDVPGSVRDAVTWSHSVTSSLDDPLSSGVISRPESMLEEATDLKMSPAYPANEASTSATPNEDRRNDTPLVASHTARNQTEQIDTSTLQNQTGQSTYLQHNNANVTSTGDNNEVLVNYTDTQSTDRMLHKNNTDLNTTGAQTDVLQTIEPTFHRELENLRVDPCESHVCLHGGSCRLEDTSGEYVCACPVGTTGDTCEGTYRTSIEACPLVVIKGGRWIFMYGHFTHFSKKRIDCVTL